MNGPNTLTMRCIGYRLLIKLNVEFQSPSTISQGLCHCTNYITHFTETIAPKGCLIPSSTFNQVIFMLIFFDNHVLLLWKFIDLFWFCVCVLYRFHDPLPVVVACYVLWKVQRLWHSDYSRELIFPWGCMTLQGCRGYRIPAVLVKVTRVHFRQLILKVHPVHTGHYHSGRLTVQ